MAGFRHSLRRERVAFVLLGALLLGSGWRAAAAPTGGAKNALSDEAKARLAKDLFGAGCDMCREGQYRVALWSLRQAVELANVRWNPETMTLSGTATRPAGETGNLFLHAPQGWRVQTPQGLWIAKDGNDQSLIVRKQLAFGEGASEWEVRFARI